MTFSLENYVLDIYIHKEILSINLLTFLRVFWKTMIIFDYNLL